jgi:predicted metal-dependent peptidase
MAQGFYLPSLNAPEIGKVILAVDTSGSINQEEIKSMVSEIKGILNAYPGTELTVIFCNNKIQGEPETLTQHDDLKEIPRPGGGTDFRPPFDHAEKEQLDPKALIYFTDGECNDFPDPAPDYPVLWILTQEPTCYPWKPPTGETVFLAPEDRQQPRR